MTETKCFTSMQLYYMLLWRLLNFTNKSLNQYKYNSFNVLQPVLCSIWYDMNSTPKY